MSSKARKYDPDTDSPEAAEAYMTAVGTIARRLGMGRVRAGGPRAEQEAADAQVLAHLVWSCWTKLEKLLEATLQRPTL